MKIHTLERRTRARKERKCGERATYITLELGKKTRTKNVRLSQHPPRLSQIEAQKQSDQSYNKIMSRAQIRDERCSPDFCATYYFPTLLLAYARNMHSHSPGIPSLFQFGQLLFPTKQTVPIVLDAFFNKLEHQPALRPSLLLMSSCHVKG